MSKRPARTLASGLGRWLTISISIGLLLLTSVMVKENLQARHQPPPRYLSSLSSDQAALAPLAAAEVEAVGISGPYTATTRAASFDGHLERRGGQDAVGGSSASRCGGGGSRGRAVSLSLSGLSACRPRGGLGGRPGRAG